jgi:hypothetical protein
MFYSVDRSGLYQTGHTLDLWQQDPLLGRPFWRLPDWFEADRRFRGVSPECGRAG